MFFAGLLCGKWVNNFDGTFLILFVIVQDVRTCLPTIVILLVTLVITVTVIPYAFSTVFKLVIPGLMLCQIHLMLGWMLHFKRCKMHFTGKVQSEPTDLT